MTRYAMVADLERCVGCQTCSAACRHANHTSPGVQWRKVLDIEAGSYPDVARVFVPVGCQHCEDPPCMHVCPTTATRKRADGIVTVDYDLCIGCAYCDVACPYQARFKISRPRRAFGVATRDELLGDDARLSGVSQKCTFCSDRIDAGTARGLVPGLDPEATPACVNACIADALHFGDTEDPRSNVSQLLRDNTHFRMHEELGTTPGFYYLNAYRHRDARPVSGPVSGPDVEPRHQAHWDWKAAMNFMCGGSGAALAVVAVLLADPTLLAAGLLLTAAGLGVLFFKIGRPRRFLHVFRQPRRSWMSREAWAAAALFPLGAAYALSGWAVFAAATAAAAVAFLVCQGMILRCAKGIPVWRAASTAAVMVCTGCTEGIGLACLVHPAAYALAAAIALRGVAWLVFSIELQRAGVPVRSHAALRAVRPWLFWGGTVAPLLLLFAGWMLGWTPSTAAAAVGTPAMAAAAVITVAAGWLFKFTLVTRAAYHQGYALKHADTDIKPGWLRADTPRH